MALLTNLICDPTGSELICVLLNLVSELADYLLYYL